jgi:hypothetical protein
MSDIPASIMMDNLIDRLWNLVVGDPNSGVQGSKSISPTITAIHMCQPGIPILSKDFANMRTAFNPGGDLRPTEAFSTWVDRITDVSLLRYRPTGNLASDAYGRLVQNANSNVGEPTEEERNAYEKARQFLLGGTNPYTGEKDDRSDAYNNYEDARLNYEDAIDDYVSRWTELDLNKIEGQKLWQRDSRRLQRRIDSGWNRWNMADKNFVEQQLDIMGTKMRTLITSAISDAERKYRQGNLSSLHGGGDFYPAYTFPHSWWEESASGWTQLNVKSTSDYSHIESHTKKASAGASFLGLFSFGGGGGWSKHTENEEHESQNIDISMKVATIDIVRPWLSTFWMLCRHWFERGQKRGDVSSGDVAKLRNDMLLPLIPMQVIVARDIVLVGDWSKETRELMEQKIDAGLSLGYGPFRIGGKYEQSDTEETQTSQFEGNALRVQGMQIIGLVSTCPPISPPEDDPGLQKA